MICQLVELWQKSYKLHAHPYLIQYSNFQVPLFLLLRVGRREVWSFEPDSPTWKESERMPMPLPIKLVSQPNPFFLFIYFFTRIAVSNLKAHKQHNMGPYKRYTNRDQSSYQMHIKAKEHSTNSFSSHTMPTISFRCLIYFLKRVISTNPLEKAHHLQVQLINRKFWIEQYTKKAKNIGSKQVLSKPNLQYALLEFAYKTRDPRLKSGSQ